MPWWGYIIVEVLRMIIPAIVKAKNDPKPNPEAAKEVVSQMRGVIGEAPELKK